MTSLDPVISQALAFAAERHAGQTRKGGDAPYLSHLLQVAGLVMEAGADEHTVAAALLHDVLEDTDTGADELTERFGTRIAALVLACSDHEGDPALKGPWRQRKQRLLDQLEGADEAALTVAVADKLHNARSLADDLDREGLRTLERFSAGAIELAWYHSAVAEVLTRRHPGDQSFALASTVDRILAHLAADEE